MNVLVFATLAAVAILFFVVVFQVSHLIFTRGPKHAMGNRVEGKSLDGIEGRIDRTRVNTIENLAMFIPVVLLAIATQNMSSWVITGAWIFIAARIVYTVVYIVGIPGLRTGAWSVGIGGIAAMVIGLLTV